MGLLYIGVICGVLYLVAGKKAIRRKIRKNWIGPVAGFGGTLFVLFTYFTPALPGHAFLQDHLGGKVSGGTLNCSQLERLWEAAGGSASTAFLAAEVAMAESAGREYALDTNGGASNDRGYWQINDAAHGSLSTFDPYGNARAAVIISRNGTDWSPWVTYNKGLENGQC
jgi:Lysozyme like domain